MKKLCGCCEKERAVLRRPKTAEQVRTQRSIRQFGFLSLFLHKSRTSNEMMVEDRHYCFESLNKVALQFTNVFEQGCIMAAERPALQLCRECFYHNFEEEIHETIVKYKLFKKGERVAVGASGKVIM
jgi:hypothetical protein